MMQRHPRAPRKHPLNYREAYDEAWPKITRTLERLCETYGFDMVLGIFSSDMPDHRREREREAGARARRKRPGGSEL
jgi:hypothetical protein